MIRVEYYLCFQHFLEKVRASIAHVHLRKRVFPTFLAHTRALCVALPLSYNTLPCVDTLFLLLYLHSKLRDINKTFQNDKIFHMELHNIPGYFVISRFVLIGSHQAIITRCPPQSEARVPHREASHNIAEPYGRCFP